MPLCLDIASFNSKTHLKNGVDEGADELELAQYLLVLRGEQRLLRELWRRQQFQHREAGRGNVLLAAAPKRGRRVATAAQLSLQAVETARPEKRIEISCVILNMC